MLPFATDSHRRFNPLSGEWVLVAPGRLQRPWLGQREGLPVQVRPSYDPDCYLCPGNARVTGEFNPDYSGTFVFINDFASLIPTTEELAVHDDVMFQAETERGTCRVICFSPRHDLSLGTLGVAGIRGVVDLWADQCAELGVDHRWVQVFENRGSEMGASNPHPHGQVWAGSALPVGIEREGSAQEAYRASHRNSLLVDYAEAEGLRRERVVAENTEWLAVVPFWASWPYETLVLPRRPIGRISDLDSDQRTHLAGCLEELLGRYDNLFGRPFPYSMGWHGAPGGDSGRHWQLHAHFYPPLLDPDRRKFMVGYELLAEVQRDLTPESAAEHLRSA